MNHDNAGDQDRYYRLQELDPEQAAGELDALVGQSQEAAPVPAIRALSDHHQAEALMGLISIETAARLADLLADLLAGPDGATHGPVAWDLLNLLRRRRFLRRVQAAGAAARWADRFQRLIDSSEFTFSRLFQQRAAHQPSRTLFIDPGPQGPREVTWRQVSGRVDLLARALLAITADDDPGLTVAVLAKNCLEMALVDLACLTTGVVNVMIPPTASEADVAYALGHANVGTVLVSSSALAQTVLGLREKTPAIRRIISLDGSAPDRDVLSLAGLLDRAAEVSRDELQRRRDAIRLDDLASVMYTSGTTGTPKGICFSHRNVVSKRFHRALALPEIGEGDRFLCYLPLFHTFGRFLEMTGCVFWGATYVFAESPSMDAMLRQMQTARPSVFISIPIKWMQLYEAIAAEVDVETAPDDDVQQAVQRTTGGNLRWGLSAAGYLDPEIFRFMQRNGVELMSGFGMTEATGGITMTPPGGYQEDSLGPALPGIELCLADDGELLIKGPYVMQGYLSPPDGAASFDDQGWFHTGDLMEQSNRGYLRIVDRKKEIYKNVKGQTVAPQKIENLFKDFDLVSRVFLVGDHRPYNTALFYLDLESADEDLRALSAEEIRTQLGSLVVTANSFLAPYERIVDFARIERDFDLDQGELTPKNTYRRKTIERNFADTIRLLYQRNTYSVGGVEVLLPNWLFQELGVTAQDLEVAERELCLADNGTRLRIQRVDDRWVQVGQVVYHHRGDKALNLGTLLSVPHLWLGNEDLLGFAPLHGARRTFKSHRHLNVSWERRSAPFVSTEQDLERVEALIRISNPRLMELHPAALLMESDDADLALVAIRALEHVLDGSEGDVADTARRVLRRATASPQPAVVRRAFQVLVASTQGRGCRRVLTAFLDAYPALLDRDTVGVLVERDLERQQMEAFFGEASARVEQAATSAEAAEVAAGLLGLLAEYGADHPSSFRGIRAFITRVAVGADDEPVRVVARRELKRLQAGFRAWLGSPSRIAVDPENGLEYRWEDVVAFSDEVSNEARGLLLDALRGTSMLREGVFLFAGRATVNLSDIPPGGVWITPLGSDHGKTVYRMAVRTRTRDQYDLAINLNDELTAEQVSDEIDWLVVCGAVGDEEPLVEVFGGWWPEHGLWTEEFIAGQTLDRTLKRMSRKPRERDRMHAVWISTAWSALAAYIEFWRRSGRLLEVADPKPSNVVVSTHDYHASARLVSISARRPFTSIYAMLTSLRRQFIEQVERQYPELEGLAGWTTASAALLEVVGEAEGQRLLQQLLADPSTADDPQLQAQVADFLQSVQRRGFLPMRLFFAGKRFRKWMRINAKATRRAKARTLREIYSTYGLQGLQDTYPEARTRFFRDTVFRTSAPPLTEGLNRIINQLRQRELEADGVGTAVADLRAHLDLEPDDDFFLARLSYPYLRPEDEAEYVAATAAGVQQSEMVVTLSDSGGDPFRVRHALIAKEIGRLHRLFLTAKLLIQFRKEHHFLVAISERGHLMGGLCYENLPELGVAHIDKVVVAEPYRGRGVAGQLIEELCNRCLTAGLTSVTTGFFRPQFFYRLGFAVEKRYAGLVKRLDEQPT